jgi:hypothetical protein
MSNILTTRPIYLEIEFYKKAGTIGIGYKNGAKKSRRW